MKIILTIITCMALFAIGCRNDSKCSRSYILTNPVEVYPVKDLYEIGDTIWFSMNFSDSIVANITNNWSGDSWDDTIVLKNFDFQRNFLFVDMIVDSTKSTKDQSPSWKSFSPRYEVGTIVNIFDDGPEYKLVYTDNSYHMKIGIICLESGWFFFSPGFQSYYNAVNPASNIKITGECNEEYLINIWFPVNRQPDGTYLTNYHLFARHMDTTLQNNLPAIKQECFTFHVK